MNSKSNKRRWFSVFTSLPNTSQKGLELGDTQSRYFRLTLDRVDRESNQVRVEIAPAAKDNNLDLFSMLDDSELVEDLSWWDLDQLEVRQYSISELSQRLGLSEETLTEGMVFWLLGGDQFVEKIEFATMTARALSRKLYTNVLTRGGVDKLDSQSD